MPEPRVFVTHAAMRRTGAGEEMVHDYSDAERFGTLRFVSLGRRNWANTESFEAFDDALEDFDPSRDFLLPSGDPVSIVAATLRVVRSPLVDQLGPTGINVLVHDRQSNAYAVIRIY